VRWQNTRSQTVFFYMCTQIYVNLFILDVLCVFKKMGFSFQDLTITFEP